MIDTTELRAALKHFEDTPSFLEIEPHNRMQIELDRIRSSLEIIEEILNG